MVFTIVSVAFVLMTRNAYWKTICTMAHATIANAMIHRWPPR